MQIRIAAVESQGRPVAAFRCVYRLQPDTPGSASLPRFASCSTFALGCFVVQTFGASSVTPAAPPAPHGRTHLVMNPPTGPPSSGHRRRHSMTQDSTNSRILCSR